MATTFTVTVDSSAAVNYYAGHHWYVKDTSDPRVALEMKITGAVAERRSFADCLTEGTLPHKILLTGPPGNGKTTLAGAIAHELGLPFFVLACRVNWLTTKISPSISFTEMFGIKFSSSKILRFTILLLSHSISVWVSASSMPNNTNRPF